MRQTIARCGIFLCFALIVSWASFSGAQLSAGVTFTSLASFSGTNGNDPLSIVQGADGKLWGVTVAGGTPNCGTVFNMTLAGKLTNGFTFKCSNGNEPQGLTLGTDGNYYGITFRGGSNNRGIVFKLTAKGVLTALSNFMVEGSGGSSDPVGSLVQGIDGNFYGATSGGGIGSGAGTMFKITPGGKLSTLYQFDYTHGSAPYAGPMEGTDGNFYGTTYSGGVYGAGTVYKMTPQGHLSVLYSFGGVSGGPLFPVTSLIQGTDGNFYGTTSYGGPDNDGTVYKITPGGALTVLHNFAQTDGRWPGGLVQATDGNFYGTTFYGGVYDGGTIFKVTATGTVTTLHSFHGTDGTGPATLIQNTNGTFYGITGAGGDLNCNPSVGCGTVFSLATGLGPFVETVPAIGTVGSPVIILGTNLNGVTGVSFHGTAALFNVVSSSEIVTTVPTGARTGKVIVTTAKGTLSSNVVFKVAN